VAVEWVFSDPQSEFLHGTLLRFLRRYIIEASPALDWIRTRDLALRNMGYMGMSPKTLTLDLT
jgi:hypothetical protein